MHFVNSYWKLVVMILLYEGQSITMVYNYIGVAHGPAGPAMAGPIFSLELIF